MAQLFNDPAIERIVRFSAGGTPPPTWMDIFEKHRASTNNFNGKGVNSWNQDESHRATKLRFDQEYVAALDAYNKAHKTNIQPDKAVLGVDVNPNEWHDPSKNVDQRGGFIGKQIDNLTEFVKDPSKSVTNLGADISKSPLAQAVITAAATMYGVPPNITKALLTANDVAQGADPAKIALNIATQYASQYATKGLNSVIGSTGNKVADSAIKSGVSGGVNAGLRGGNVLEGAAQGAVGSVVGAGKNYVGSVVGDAFKETGIPQYLTDAAKQLNAPGIFDAAGKVLPNIKEADVKSAVAAIPGGSKLLNTLQNPGTTLVNSMLNSAGNVAKDALSNVLGGNKTTTTTTTTAKAPTVDSGRGNILALMALLENPNTPPAEKARAEAEIQQQPDALAWLTQHADSKSALQQLIG